MKFTGRQLCREWGKCHETSYPCIASFLYSLPQPKVKERLSLSFIFPTKHGIPKSLKVGHWLSPPTKGRMTFKFFAPWKTWGFGHSKGIGKAQSMHANLAECHTSEKGCGYFLVVEPTHLKKLVFKLDIFSQIGVGILNKYLKPPPRLYLLGTQRDHLTTSCQSFLLASLFSITLPFWHPKTPVPVGTASFILTLQQICSSITGNILDGPHCNNNLGCFQVPSKVSCLGK